jgi:deoxyribodipyrimidine photo-lyase
MIPSLRIQTLQAAPVRPDGDFVLYWMIAARRPGWSFALQRAADWSRQLGKPLVVLEPLRVAYPWASDRLHTFVLQGMASNAKRFRKRGVTYLPYVENAAGAGKGLLAELAGRACLVVTDDYPTYFLPRMIATASRTTPVRMEGVDGNGLLPMRAASGVFARAFDFRRFLQKQIAPHLRTPPVADPLMDLPTASLALASVTQRWPMASEDELERAVQTSSRMAIDHGVVPGSLHGGFDEGTLRIRRFVTDSLQRYGLERNHPDDDASSGLSPYLHFGHVSAHQVASAVWDAEGWSVDRLGDKANGAKEGWWGLPASAESFLDELVTWRELGFNMAWQRDDHDKYSSLPAWARATLEEHASDSRDRIYDLAAFEQARTHDPIWNAAQTELVREGRMHNYLRMLWGKNILAWSESPRAALAIMTELNNKYALDGRDPNSVSGIFWVLGRYDRAWGPERPVFGKVRYMTSESTRRKLRLQEYLRRYGEGSRHGG